MGCGWGCMSIICDRERLDEKKVKEPLILREAAFFVSLTVTISRNT